MPSANRATEANHVSVGVGDGALPLAIVLIPQAIHFDPHLSPLLSHTVGILTVDIESTVTRRFVSYSLGKMDREIPIPVNKGVRFIVEGHPEAQTLKPNDRASYVGHLEDRIEPGD